MQAHSVFFNFERKDNERKMALKEIAHRVFDFSPVNFTVVDKVPNDMLHLVDMHWYKFPALLPIWHLALGIFLTILLM